MNHVIHGFVGKLPDHCLASVVVSVFGVAVFSGCHSVEGPPHTDAPSHKASQSLDKDRGYPLKGHILDEGSAPILGAQVTLLGNLEPSEWEFLNSLICTLGIEEFLARRGRVLASTSSGPDGSYRFEGVMPGAYTLRVTAKGFAFREQDILFTTFP